MRGRIVMKGTAALAMAWLLQGCDDDDSKGRPQQDGAIEDGAGLEGGVQDAVAAQDQQIPDSGAETGPSTVPVDAGVTDPGTAQTPPRGSLNAQAWLATGAYKSWNCEGGIEYGRLNSNHGKNRVCSNDLLSSSGSGEYPVGAASVQELYDNVDTLVGHAIQLKVQPGGDTSSWYFYENLYKVTFVDGAGAASGACGTCHSTAGPTTMGHDFVFVHVW